jgi:glycosyltransferase involved in cell wall biosynthesis
LESQDLGMEKAGQVGVICIAYNHEQWIEEALESVRLQDYYAKELIIVDNGSEDQTPQIIRNWVNQNGGKFPVQVFIQKEQKPYCTLFNEFLERTQSQYVIDLSGDDVLYPDHLSKSVEELSKMQEAAFVFSDAYILDDLNEVRTFFKRNNAGELVEEIELSTIYETLIRRNLICSPTVMFNASILKKEGGYDTSLYYEDFDIQLRLARNYPVLFSDHIGVLKRKHNRSMSSDQYSRYNSQMLPTTVKVCQKIRQMNLTPEEDKALGERILFELKHALWSANFDSAKELVKMGEEIGIKGPFFWTYKFWTKTGWDISWIYVRVT